MRKQILATFLCGFLALNLTACSLPFFGEQNVEQDSSENKISRTPDENFYLMFDKMRNDIKTADYQAEVAINATIDQSKLSKGTKSDINNKLLALGVDRPHVLGIDTSADLKVSVPPTAPQVKPLAGNTSLELDMATRGSVQKNLKDTEGLELNSFASDSGNQASLFDFGKNKMKVKLNYEVDGKFDYNDEENIRGESTMEMEVDVSGLIVRFDFEAKILNENIYIKVGQLPPPFSMMIDSEKLDKWWNINLQELEEEQQKKDSIFSDSLPDDFDFDMYFNDEKSKALEAELEKIVNKYKLFKVGEVLAEETIDGKLCYQYKIELNKSIIKNAFLEIYDLVEAEIDKNFESLALSYKDDEKMSIEIEEARAEIDDEVKEQIEDVLGQLVNIIDDYDLSVWIDKETHFLRKTKFDFKLNLKNLELEELTDEIKDAVEIDIAGVVSYSNINQEVNIVAPIESESIISFLSNMFADSQMKSRNARRLSDVKQMQTALELFYNDNGSYPDSLTELSNEKMSYMRALPENPKPSDGNCLADSDYSYQAEEAKQNYKLSYCLGASTAGVPAGNNTASASGLYDQLKSSIIQPPANINTDTDLDGLFDQDEINIYKTDPNDSDTDNDGYLDGDEVKNGYNPAGEGDLPSSIIYNSDWLDYSTDEFSIKYPRAWEMDNKIASLSEEQRLLAGIKVLFLSPYTDTSDTFKENILVNIVDLKDSEYKTVDAWYQESVSEKNEDEILESNKMSILGQPGIEEIYTTVVENDLVKTKVRHLERYFIKDQKLYSLQFSADDNNGGVLEHGELAVKIIDSFNLKN